MGTASLSLFILSDSTNVQTGTSAAEEQLVERKLADAESARVDAQCTTEPQVFSISSGLTSELLFPSGLLMFSVTFYCQIKMSISSVFTIFLPKFTISITALV